VIKNLIAQFIKTVDHAKQSCFVESSVNVENFFKKKKGRTLSMGLIGKKRQPSLFNDFKYLICFIAFHKIKM
jgi:hypothetical protein